jgi:hypothetical protein
MELRHVSPTTSRRAAMIVLLVLSMCLLCATKDSADIIPAPRPFTRPSISPACGYIKCFRTYRTEMDKVLHWIELQSFLILLPLNHQNYSADQIGSGKSHLAVHHV